MANKPGGGIIKPGNGGNANGGISSGQVRQCVAAGVSYTFQSLSPKSYYCTVLKQCDQIPDTQARFCKCSVTVRGQSTGKPLYISQNPFLDASGKPDLNASTTDCAKLCSQEAVKSCPQVNDPAPGKPKPGKPNAPKPGKPGGGSTPVSQGQIKQCIADKISYRYQVISGARYNCDVYQQCNVDVPDTSNYCKCDVLKNGVKVHATDYTPVSIMANGKHNLNAEGQACASTCMQTAALSCKPVDPVPFINNPAPVVNNPVDPAPVAVDPGTAVLLEPIGTRPVVDTVTNLELTPLNPKFNAAANARKVGR